MGDVGIEQVTLAVLTFILIGMLVVFGTERILNLDERARMRTVDIPAGRIDSSLYMMDSIEEGSLEMRLKAEYSLNRTDGETYLTYHMNNVLISSENSSQSAPISPTATRFQVEEGENSRFCITKSPDELILEPGGC